MLLFNTCGFYLLRRPNKSIDELLALNNLIAEGNQEAFVEKMQLLFSSPEMEEAIYIASPDLFNEFKKWQRGEKMEPKRLDKLLLSLFKYYTRMSMRSTPYGLFAGCTTGTIGEEATAITFSTSASEATYKHSRLDMNYVAEISEYLSKDPVIRNQIRFFPNNSLYKAGDKYRYVEFSLHNKKRSYYLSSVSSSDYIERVLEFAKEGKRLEEIIIALVNLELGTETEITVFFEQLVKAQILVSELEPTITGEEYFYVLIKKLKSLKYTERYVKILEIIADTLKKQDNSIDQYIYIKSLIDEHFVETSSKDLIQTDLFFSSNKNNLKKQSIDLLVENLGKLLWLNKSSISASLEAFRKKFLAKYEDQEVPLTIAMDSEVGIGYGLNVNGISDFMPLLKDVLIPGEPKETSIFWDGLNKLKFEKIVEAKKTGQNSIIITDEDIDRIEKENNLKPAELPNSFYLFGSLLAKSANEIDQGNFKFLLNCLSGPSAGNLMGRFCHGDPTLLSNVKECFEFEEKNNPDIIFAEIVHLPESRIGNILIRPELRGYEIPYLGQSSVPETNQIPISDILVSIRHNKIILRSKKFNKKILPRLSSAHNFARGLPIYKFLCEFQSQDQSLGVFWDWQPFEQETFLPRIEYKNIIMSRARWCLKKKDFPELENHTLDLVSFFASIKNQWNIPRYVAVREGDNELFLDLENLACLQSLAQSLRKRNVVLLEFLSTPEQCFIKENNLSYSNEVIIPFVKASSTPNSQQLLFAENLGQTSIKRSFMPGSEWLYVKIYTGNKNADKVLTEIILPLTEKLLKDKIIDKWFFIRYNDPEGHLRIRFHHANNKAFWKEVLHRLYQDLNIFLAQGLITKVLTDTYQREIERYGTSTMVLSESLFFSDSVAIAEFLDLIEGDVGERYRWLFAIRNIDMLLDDFKYNLSQKYELLERLQKGFYQEFLKNSQDDKLLHSLNDKYRVDSKAVENILDYKSNSEDVLLGVACFNRRSIRNKPIISQLLTAINSSNSKDLDNLLCSYIHMTMNRTFISKQRMHELVIYHYLSKHYKSQLARLKKQKTNSAPVLALQV